MEEEHREPRRPDRRRVPRGGRRATDRPGRHPVVLVADSYEGARVPYARYLEERGFLVQQAADGEQMLAMINALPPHVILAAYGLRSMPLSRLSRWLSQNWRMRRIPVIVLAGDAELPAGAEPEPDAAGLLIKPFRLSAMLDEIRRVLRAHAE
jgi:DNA-binding response OmpR family regulator